MKKYIFLTLAFATILVAPIGLNAAYDDVTLTTDAVISINSISLTVSGSSATIASIVVNANDFVATLQSGSTMTVTSSANKDFSTNAGSSIATETCATGSGSTLALTSSSASDIVVIVTVTSDTCVVSTTSTATASSGGGGGGGGSSSASAPGVITTTPRLQIVHPDGTIEYLDEDTTTTTTDDTVTVAQAEITTTTTTTSASGISSAFTKALKRSESNSDIKRLQQLLNSDPDTAVAESGVGSAGNETNYYGSLTEKAVQKFQAKYGIVSSGTPDTTGYGLVGPKTRAMLATVFGDTTTTPAATVAQPSEVAVSVSPVFTGGLSRGSSNSDIKRLQQLLNSDPDTAVAESGVGSAGNETNYYGSLTEKAVQKFQMKHGVVSSSDDPGYGYVGPKTRAKFSEIFGQ